MTKTIPLTFIYSSSSVEPFEKLVNTILDLKGEHVLRVNDIFDYGVFCTTGTYTFYPWCREGEYDFEIPEVLTSECTPIKEKEYFVNSVIEEVMEGKREKPEWMLYVEEEKSCNLFDDEPSNFLRIKTNYLEYMDLAEDLIAFLYSPSKITKMMN